VQVYNKSATSALNLTMPNTLRNRLPLAALMMTLVNASAIFGAPILKAQTLPPPSRTMYKCKVNGTTTYSETPCLGATRIEVEPTRGVSTLSGRQRTGSDVLREQQQEGLAAAIRPVTGMDAKQFKLAERRYALPAAAQQACRQLD
jgi:hypothetical protein